MLVVIVNPIAGGGRSLAACEAACKELTNRSIPYRVAQTNAVDHAARLSRQAVDDGAEGVVGVGGDGTLSEIVAGLTTRALPLYFVPCGTGNDFARMLRLPSDPARALAAQLDGESARLDMLTVNGRGFLNIAGTGFDVEALRQTDRFKNTGRGILPYLLGVAAALRRFRPPRASLTLDNGEVLQESFTLLTFANGQYFGGGMRVAARALPADGWMEVIAVKKVAKPLIALLFPLFIGGWFLWLPFCRTFRCRRVSLSSPGMTLQADGELHDMDAADIRLLPGHLPVRLPAAALKAIGVAPDSPR